MWFLLNTKQQTWRKFMLIKSFLAMATILVSTTVLANTDAVSYQEAPKFYNQTKTVEGTVAATFCDDKRCFLNFDKDYHKYLSAVIESTDLPKFTKATGKNLQSEMDKMYLGKKVQITGAITEYKSKDPAKPGRPQILLTDSAKIKVLVK